LKRFPLVLFIILFSALGGIAVRAQDPATPQSTDPRNAAPQSASPHNAPAAQTVTGTVVSAGNISLVIRTDDGSEKTFVVTTTTQMPQIAAGDRVTVSYQPLDEQHGEAASVTLGTATSPSAPAAATAVPPVPDGTESASSAWEFVAFVGLIALLVGLGVAMLAGLIRPAHARRRHTHPTL